MVSGAAAAGAPAAGAAGDGLAAARRRRPSRWRRRDGRRRRLRDGLGARGRIQPRPAANPRQHALVLGAGRRPGGAARVHGGAGDLAQQRARLRVARVDEADDDLVVGGRVAREQKPRGSAGKARGVAGLAARHEQGKHDAPERRRGRPRRRRALARGAALVLAGGLARRGRGRVGAVRRRVAPWRRRAAVPGRRRRLLLEAEVAQDVVALLLLSTLRARGARRQQQPGEQHGVLPAPTWHRRGTVRKQPPGSQTRRDRRDSARKIARRASRRA